MCYHLTEHVLYFNLLSVGAIALEEGGGRICPSFRVPTSYPLLPLPETTAVPGTVTREELTLFELLLI